MKTLLAIVGALAIFVVGVFAVLIVIGLNSIKPMKAEAVAYADEAIQAIATDWDDDAFVDRASAALLSQLSQDELRVIMAFGQHHLGPMSDYQGAACEIVGFEYTTKNGERVTATCEARAEHERGAASYALTLLKQNDNWSMLGFFVTPDELQAPDTTRTVNMLSALTVSFQDRSIGMTSRAYTPIGADIRGFAKIENLP